MSLFTGAAADGAAAITGGLTVAMGLGPGANDGHYAADIALGLTNAAFELMAASKGAMNAEHPQLELAGHIDGVAAARTLNELAARLLDFWYAVRTDALSPWGLHLQSTWVKMCYLMKYGDLRLAPGLLAQITCGLLLELSEGFRPERLSWEPAQSDAWTAALLHVAGLVEDLAPPPGWVFPVFAIVRKAETAFVAPTFYVGRGDAKGIVTVKAAGMLAQLSSAGSISTPRPEGCSSGPVDPAARDVALGRLRASFETASVQVGDAANSERVLRKSERLFNQKTRPMHFLNQASSPLKICLFSAEDKICAVPVGGVGGPCVVTLEPGRRAQLRPPGDGKQFQLKVMSPGLMDSALYYAMVERGASVQLRSHECTLEG